MHLHSRLEFGLAGAHLSQRAPSLIVLAAEWRLSIVFDGLRPSDEASRPCIVSRNLTSNRGPSRGKPNDRWDAWAWGAGLVLLVFAVYWPTLSNGFIWDDDLYIETNVPLSSLGGLYDIWFTPRAIPQYYPLVHSMFWVEYHLWGTRPIGFHAVNLLLHATSVVLAWRLLARLAVPGVWLAAAIFAVHPVEVESVAWATAQECLVVRVALASLLAYVRFALAERAVGSAVEHSEEGVGASAAGPAWGLYALSLAFYIAALLSKTVAASVPAVALVILWWKHGAYARDVALWHHFLPSAWRWPRSPWCSSEARGGRRGDWDFSVADRVLIAGRAVGFTPASSFGRGR